MKNQCCAAKIGNIQAINLLLSHTNLLPRHIIIYQTPFQVDPCDIFFLAFSLLFLFLLHPHLSESRARQHISRKGMKKFRCFKKKFSLPRIHIYIQNYQSATSLEADILLINY